MYIIDVSEDYTWALIGSPDRHHVWILAKEIILDQFNFDRLTRKLSQLGFDIEKLIVNKPCTYTDY